MKKTFTLLLSIVMLAAVLRFNHLSQNPISLNLDEVAIGYNAYSILKTGMDEYGEKYPFAFRSHDDYKPPLYIYLTVPSVALFGLDAFAVRFPSALAGTLTVLITFFLVKELFQESRFLRKVRTGKIQASKLLALTSALLLAISPWHIQFSRAGFETNVAVLFIVLGVWIFLLGLRKDPRFFVITAVSFALSLYTYQAARLFIPLFSLLIMFLYKDSIFRLKKEAFIATAVFIILVSPLLPVVTSETGLMRFKGTSIFEHPGIIEEEEERRLIDAENQDRFAFKFLHNRRFASLMMFAEGYLKHFRPDVIFLGQKGPPFNYVPNTGLLYLIELPFFMWGFINLWKQKDLSKYLLTGWLLLSPIASALTWDAPSSTRTTISLPTYQIITALGLFPLFQKVSLRARIRLASMGLIAFVFLISFIYFIHQNQVHAPLEYASSWQYGYQEAVKYAEEHKNQYDRIIVSTQLKQPHNFFAFYTKYDPWTYINVDGGTVSGGFLEDKNKFDIYEFHDINYSSLSLEEKSLLIDLYKSMPDEFKDKALTIIYLPDGEPEIIISET
jgi:4-amino-4-deoxy-L-arabinose transferase-like glycosyltransferase